MLPASAHQCHPSVPVSATYQCQSVPPIMLPISATYQSLSVPVSAAYQCASVPPISAHQCCLSVLANSA
ncbi:unnamed protein product [Staurois parvus]|uniref:Uncharacterized protein n=1 Tax=Staurois parvus TaxID=386267 RepID=A0ABN9H719_9NEOB|nr:unnamed protein product [Staurois parvus]